MVVCSSVRVYRKPMKSMFSASILRTAFLEFFAARAHAVIPSASLIPENDPTVLFTTAGMHPLVPYIVGEKHPLGKRLANIQKCIRTQDIEEVGDHRHITFFEMLGAWSLGDYSKSAIIPWTYEFFTRILGLAADRLYVSVYEGDADVPSDTESISVWQQLFAKDGLSATVAPSENPNVTDGHRIFQYGRAKNWWGPVGASGPCGPDTEIFYRTDSEHEPRFGNTCHPNCNCGQFIEIGNDVFIEYAKEETGSFSKLAQATVDIGWGLERLLALVQNASSLFTTDLFEDAVRFLERRAGVQYLADAATTRSLEIIADHARAATFILGDNHNIAPSNVDQGYILRRFLRRAIRHGRLLGLNKPFLRDLAEIYIGTMGTEYPELDRNRQHIMQSITHEEQVFGSTIAAGERHFFRVLKERQGAPGWVGMLSGTDAFHLYDTFGFPLEMTIELAQDNGVTIDLDGYRQEFARHQAISRAGAEQKFAGGLADRSDRVVRMHTATHLLHSALRKVLGPHVHQKGSNINSERLRFDFSHDKKMTLDEIAKVEAIVNAQISNSLPVSFVELPVEEARARQVIGDFEDRYGDVVKVYDIGDFSHEICGGPHVANTRLIGTFKILKEEASSKGVRRIKAIVNDDILSDGSTLPLAGPFSASKC